MSSELISRMAATLRSCSGPVGLVELSSVGDFDGVDGADEDNLVSFSGDGASLSPFDKESFARIAGPEDSSSTAVVVSELATDGLLFSSSRIVVSVEDAFFSSASLAALATSFSVDATAGDPDRLSSP